MSHPNHIKIKIQKLIRDKVREVEKRFIMTAKKDQAIAEESKRIYELNHIHLDDKVTHHYNDLDIRVKNLSRLVYMGVGGALLLEIIFRFFYK